MEMTFQGTSGQGHVMQAQIHNRLERIKHFALQAIHVEHASLCSTPIRPIDDLAHIALSPPGMFHLHLHDVTPS